MCERAANTVNVHEYRERERERERERGAHQQHINSTQNIERHQEHPLTEMLEHPNRRRLERQHPLELHVSTQG
jgi:hypothetical protein